MPSDEKSSLTEWNSDDYSSQTPDLYCPLITSPIPEINCSMLSTAIRGIRMNFMIYKCIRLHVDIIYHNWEFLWQTGAKYCKCKETSLGKPNRL